MFDNQLPFAETAKRPLPEFSPLVAAEPTPRITRLKGPSCWRVRFKLHRNRVVRVFKDDVYGSALEAKQAAEAFANDEGMYCQEVLWLMRRLYVRTNSRSGLPGVTRIERIHGGRPFWIAYWDENGIKIQKKFSVALYGDAEAKKLAIDARDAGVRPYVRRLEELKANLGLE